MCDTIRGLLHGQNKAKCGRDRDRERGRDRDRERGRGRERETERGHNVEQFSAEKCERLVRRLVFCVFAILAGLSFWQNSELI